MNYKEIRFKRNWNNYVGNMRRILAMFRKFERNRVKFNILYCKNRICRIIHYKNLNWVAEI